MDVISKFFIVPKHTMRKGKRARRAYHDVDERELMERLASQYAAQNGEDYLIVQVVAEVSKPEGAKQS